MNAPLRLVGNTAMDQALEAIAAIPSPFSPVALKNRVRRIMRSGPQHPFVWTRFQRLADAARSYDQTHCLSAMRLHIEIVRRTELRKREASLRLWGRNIHPRGSMMLIDEARLVLRWMQRYAPVAYPWVRDAILYPELASEAAE